MFKHFTQQQTERCELESSPVQIVVWSWDTRLTRLQTRTKPELMIWKNGGKEGQDWKKTVHEKGKVGESKEGKEGHDWKLILNHRQGGWKHSHLTDGVWMVGTNMKPRECKLVLMRRQPHKDKATHAKLILKQSFFLLRSLGPRQKSETIQSSFLLRFQTPSPS